MDLQTQLQELKTSTQAKLAEMRGEHSKELQELRVAVLGKKGSLTDLLKGLKDLPNEERPKVGKMVNEVRDVLTEAFDEAAKIVEAAKIQAQLDSESLDVTLPGRQVKLGNRHILSQTAEEIEDIFLGMGFQIVDGFEVETDYYNFERMNLPKDHPARDMQDTFYITEEILLRTHTSPVQARTLDKHDFSKGPLKMISPGRVFRRDTDDATHSHQFHQIEGLVVGKNISMGDLKGTLEMIIKKCLVQNVKSVCVHLTSHSLSLQLRLTCHASSVVVKDVTYVRRQVGLKSSVQVWFTHKCLRCQALILKNTQVSPSVLVKNVLPCFVMVSTTFVVSTKGMFASQNSLNKV